MDPTLLMMLMGGMTAMQMAETSANAKKQNELAAATERYSPWTGMRSQGMTTPNLSGIAMQGLTQGIAQNAAIDQAAKSDKILADQNAYNDKLLGIYEKRYAPPAAVDPNAAKQITNSEYDKELLRLDELAAGRKPASFSPWGAVNTQRFPGRPY